MRTTGFRLSQILERYLSENAMPSRQNGMLLAVLLGLVWAGAAFGAADDWTRTALVAPGSRVIVKTFSGEEKQGTFRSAGANSISLSVNGLDLDIQRSEVARIRVYTPSRHLRNVKIGAAVGAAGGLGVG